MGRDGLVGLGAGVLRLQVSGRGERLRVPLERRKRAWHVSLQDVVYTKISNQERVGHCNTHTPERTARMSINMIPNRTESKSLSGLF